jgi:hypothetical protein
MDTELWKKRRNSVTGQFCQANQEPDMRRGQIMWSRNVMGGSDSSPITMDVFIRDDSETPLGKLFLALLQETRWSNDFTVSGYFGKISRLKIDHRAFAFNQMLVIDDVSKDITVCEVEEAVRAHLQKAQDSLAEQISILRKEQHALALVEQKIASSKANLVQN